MAVEPRDPEKQGSDGNPERIEEQRPRSEEGTASSTTSQGFKNKRKRQGGGKSGKSSEFAGTDPLGEKSQFDEIARKEDANPLEERSPIDAFWQTQEKSRQWVQSWLFVLISGCFIYLALYDFFVASRPGFPQGTVAVVNSTFAGGAGILGLCATYILNPYKRSRGSKKKKKSRLARKLGTGP